MAVTSVSTLIPAPIGPGVRVVFFLALAAALVSGNARAQAGIVARVNGEPVTREELERAAANPLDQNEALRKLIHRRLILQEADRRNFTVAEEDLDRAITSLRQRFEDLKTFGLWMKQQGLDDRSLIENLRTDMLASRVRAALVETVRLTSDDIQEYYEAHKRELKPIEQVRLQIIVVKEKAAARQILAAARRGDDFSALARLRSAGLRAPQGGDTGWVDLRTLAGPLRGVVAGLKAGEISGPWRRGEEFFVVRLAERRPARTRSLAEARAEIEPRLLTEKQEETVRLWLAEREKNSKIEVFLNADEHSEGK